MRKVRWRKNADGKILKICTRCEKEKHISEYGKHQGCTWGRNPWCKACVKQYRLDNIARIKAAAKERYQLEQKTDPDWVRNNRERATQYYVDNKDKVLQYHQEYRASEVNKKRQSRYHKTYRVKNQARLKAYQKRYGKENRKRLNAYERDRKRNDPVFRLRRIVSSTVSAALRKRGRTKGGATFLALGYSPADLKTHLERLFTSEMSWDNYGTYWTIDHIMPQVCFPYKDLNDPLFTECWALSNLRPLEKTENFRKNSKVEEKNA